MRRPAPAHDDADPRPPALRAESGRRAEVHAQRFTVCVSYPVVFTEDLFHAGNPVLTEVASRRAGRRLRLFAVVDDGLARRRPDLADAIRFYARVYSNEIELVAEPEVVAGGEAVKNDREAVPRLHARFAALGLDRHDAVLALGGGALLDVVGFAAGTAHRGLRLIRAPSTVLAQCDGGLGLKNGINAAGLKGFLGTFAAPFAVFNDRRLLETLAPRERVAGLAEAVKAALVRDACFFRWLVSQSRRLRSHDPGALWQAVRWAADLHLRELVRAPDPFECGESRSFELGHWAAHKLETLTHDELRHGEAVAVGLLVDARCSVEHGLLPERDFDSIWDLVAGLGLPVWHPALTWKEADGRLQVLDGLEEFRLQAGGDLALPLLRAVGEAVTVREIREELLLRGLAHLEARWARSGPQPAR
jgi:3-dehydroquinate synthase